MIVKILNKLESFSKFYFPYTNVFGLVRSIVAIGTLLILMFNSFDILIFQNAEGEFLNPVFKSNTITSKLNFF